MGDTTELTDVHILAARGRLLDALRDYDTWFIEERLRNDGLIPNSEISAAIEQFKNFIFLNAIGYSKLNMPVKQIDIVWHAFLLFTTEYAAFCDRYVGRFVHHAPVTSRNTELPTDQQDFFEVYEKVFGEKLRTDDMTDFASKCQCQSCRALIADVAGVNQAFC